ncbi:MFS transporter, partial [Bifidobacterium oedipodis]
GKMGVPAHGPSRCLVVVSKHHAIGNPWAHIIHTRCTCSENSRIQSGQYEKGFAVLEHIFGTDRARSLADNIADSVRFEREIGTSLRDLFQPGLRKALIAGIFLAVANQAIGMNVISYYGPAMLRGLGFFGDTDFLASACVAAIELVFTVVGMYLIDAVGRKRLMATGCALMCIFAVGISWGFAVQSDLITFIFVMLFTASFAFSMGPIPWIMIPELFPNHLRGRATGICTAFLLAANWAIAQFTPILLTDVGASGTFLLFAILDVACLAGVIWLPETMDRPLEDIERYWSPDSPRTAAQFAIHTADMKIRQAESMLALVENERMQALGIIEQAERDRVAAQKQLFALENEEMRRQLVARISAYQQTATAAALANQNTRYLDHVPGPHQAAESSGNVSSLHNTAVDLPLQDIEDHALAQEQHVAAMRAAAAASTANSAPLGASSNVPTSAAMPESGATAAANDQLPELPDLPPIPERASVQDAVELRRENAALRDALNSLDDLIKNKH